MRRLFEQGLEQRRQQYGEKDARTAQAARDLGQFLAREGDASAAQSALAESVRVDEAVFGADARQTFEDVASLAAVCPPAQAEPLWRRAAESPDPAWQHGPTARSGSWPKHQVIGRILSSSIVARRGTGRGYRQ